ncbi:MAG: hypothetical protein V4549_06700 [Bacteroidota bacterium]
MSLVPECLDNIIGLSETSCDCFSTGKPADFNTSKSGLFLDQLEGLSLNLAKSIEDCEEVSLWDLLAKARRNSIKAFKADVLGTLTTNYKQKREPFHGVIGSQKFSKSLSITNNYAGSRIYCSNIIGGVMSIKRIGLVFDSSQTFTIIVYDNLDDQPVAQYTVQANANVLTWFDLPSPLNLDMNNEADTENPNYYVLYQPSGFNPKDNKAGCGCGGGYRYYFNANTPAFKSYEKDRWSEYIMLAGTQGDDLSNRANWGTSEMLNGLILDVDFKCRVQDLICNENLDFESNGLALAMANAIRYKAGALLIDSILASSQINIYTMTDRERLMGKKNSYTKEYQDRISWLGDQINIKANDCLACKDFDDVIKTGIFS